MPFIANTDDDRRRMLEKIGVGSFEELLEGIPGELRHQKELQIPSLSEMELLSEIERLAAEDSGRLTCFAGGGVYDHFIPSALSTIISRPEFMTAYTPYQPEVSQGTLQVMYEFQSHICRLTGMAAANASMYDGATAAAEAVIMCLRLTRRKSVLVSETVSPFYRNVIRTYLSGRGVDMLTVPSSGGRSDLERVRLHPVVDCIVDGDRSRDVEGFPMTVEKTDLEAKLREIQGVIEETTGAAKNTGIAIAIGVVVILLIAFLSGRRKGKQGSARVEVYRLG